MHPGPVPPLPGSSPAWADLLPAIGRAAGARTGSGAARREIIAQQTAPTPGPPAGTGAGAALPPSPCRRRAAEPARAAARQAGKKHRAGEPVSVFTAYNSAANSPSDLVNAILADTAGLVLNAESFRFSGADGQVSFYDGSLTALGVGRGILLTSGDGLPGTSNTSSNHTGQIGSAGDADLDGALLKAGIDAGTNDAAYLEFSFTVTDPAIKSVTFDIAFGSEEFPEYADNVVDIAGVFVNGTNYALFGNDPTRPLSVLQRNIDGGYFRDNGAGALPIEYDGLSIPLRIVAPVSLGLNTIKIAIADTGDLSWDSGLFVSGFRSSPEAGGGIVVPPPPKRIPQALDDRGDIAEDRFSLDPRVLGGTVLANDSAAAPAIGAAAELPPLAVTAVDGAAGAVGQALQGRYGTLTLHADGRYTYSLANSDALIRGEIGLERFAYTVTNADGLSASAVLEIRVLGEDLDVTRSGTFSAHRGADRIGGSVGEDRLAGRGGDDMLEGGRGADGLWGEEGHDTLLAGDGDDLAIGGAGDDTLRLGAGADRAWGQAGRDAILGEDGDDTADGGADDDRLDLGAGADRGWGGEGADHLLGRGGDDRLSGDAGDDRLLGEAGHDRLWGGAGADVLDGGQGDDQISGGAGEDRLVLGAGNDTAWGGAGDDLFMCGPGSDVVKDFQAGDRIVLTGLYRSYAALEDRLRQEGDDVVIDLPGSGNSIRIENVGTLDKGDFLF